MSGYVALRGARVLVTGATGGLGQAIARELAGRGARLVLTGRNTDVLDPLAESLGAEAVAVDLADRGDVDRLLRECGDVDVLVANAALPGSGRLDSYTVEQVDRVLDVNLRAPIVMAHALAPRMAARGGGQLVFMSSLAGKAANGGATLYCGTKFGLRGFALSLRGDLAEQRVGVTVVNPGFISEAGMFHETGAKLPPGVRTKKPADVARAVARAIEENPVEIDVAPLSLKAGAAFGAVAPGLADAVARRLGSSELVEQMGAAQSSKR
ncbi:MAG TPA: SDR family NAD(P)-dependent oxidoreductase [Solirubrobacteraceae bacterium]|jgi:short-subunit dehydrogenase|nr:SDR family NAD(P)-dependent oxidoreductase [Solirubrobacteraceae bacterium]